MTENNKNFEEYEIIEVEPISEQENSNNINKKKNTKFMKSITGWMLSAVIFGSLAGGSFYGVNNYLGGNNKTVQTANTAIVPVSSQSENLNVSNVANIGLKSIVSITNTSVQEVQSFFGRFPQGSQFQTEVQSSGSGVVIEQSDDYIYLLTNYHVIENSKQLSVTFIDNQTYSAEIVGYDSDNDIAVLKVAKSDMSDETLNEIAIAQIGDSSKLQVGEQVVAIGNALGYGQSVTTGIISAVDRSIATDSSQEAKTYIQTDAAINPGNSGGALMNMNGELIGINTAKIASTNIEGMGYAIPIQRILEIIGDISN